MTALLRFAPSPNGRLHLGHAYSALLNAEMARRLNGHLLLRIEDIDPARSRAELIATIEADLVWLGLAFDGPVRRQSGHMAEYRRALAGLAERGLAYPCFCSRGTVRARVAAREAAGRPVPRDPDGTALYPGTCRALVASDISARREAGEPHVWRLDNTRALVVAAGPHGYRSVEPDGQGREVAADPARWGDAVIARRDVPTSYHLAVVLDDAAQGITHVVRGQDLEAATDLHVLLQRLFGLPSPAYHHHGLIRGADGGKLAKSKGSQTLADLRERGIGAAQIRAGLGFSA